VGLAVSGASASAGIAARGEACGATAAHGVACTATADHGAVCVANFAATHAATLEVAVDRASAATSAAASSANLCNTRSCAAPIDGSPVSARGATVASVGSYVVPSKTGDVAAPAGTDCECVTAVAACDA
jgi:hypothetical protein